MAAATPSPEERLVELESRQMHQDALLEKLNAVIIEQQAAIERLQRELERLKEQLHHTGEEQPEEPPPHY